MIKCSFQLRKFSIQKDFFLISLSLILIITPCFIYSQQQEQLRHEALSNLIYKTEQLLGTSDNLVNGNPYFEMHSQAKGDPYFISKDWMPGIIWIDGVQYDLKKIKFNIVLDKLVINKVLQTEADVDVLLNNQFIDSFAIGDYKFIKTTLISDLEFLFNYVNPLYKGDFYFVRTFQKAFVNQYNNNTPNGFYTSIRKELYLINSMGAEKIKSKKALLNYFHDHKRAIKKKMAANHFKFRKSTNDEWYEILNYCDNLNK
jgi:hypothetical protein